MATTTTTTTYNEIPIGVNLTVQLTAQDSGLYYLGIENDIMEVIGTSIAIAAANMTLDSSNDFLYTYIVHVGVVEAWRRPFLDSPRLFSEFSHLRRE